MDGLQQQMITLGSTPAIKNRNLQLSWAQSHSNKTDEDYKYIVFFALCCSHLIACSTMPMPSLKMKLVGVILVHIHIYPNLHTQCHFNHICDFKINWTTISTNIYISTLFAGTVKKGFAPQ